MLPREDCVEFLVSSFSHWRSLNIQDPKVLQAFAAATYEYIITADQSPQKMLRQLEDQQTRFKSLTFETPRDLPIWHREEEDAAEDCLVNIDLYTGESERV